MTGFVEYSGAPLPTLRLTLEIVDLGRSDSPTTCTFWSDGAESPAARYGPQNAHPSVNDETRDGAQTTPEKHSFRLSCQSRLNAALKSIAGAVQHILAKLPLIRDTPTTNVPSGPDASKASETQALNEVRELMEPAARWIAIESWKLQMLATSGLFPFGRGRSVSSSQVHHICGLLYRAALASDLYPNHSRFFAVASANEHKSAIKSAPAWPIPYESLAAVYANALDKQCHDEEAGREMLSEIPRLYDEAAKLYVNFDAKHRCLIGAASALHRLDNAHTLNEARELRNGALKYVERDNPAGYSVRFLFDLAASFARASSSEADAADQARRLLGYALARSLVDGRICNASPIWSWVQDRWSRWSDPSKAHEQVVYEQTWNLINRPDSVFTRLRSHERPDSLDCFKAALESEFAQDRNLPCLPYGQLSARVNTVMDKTGWIGT